MGWSDQTMAMLRSYVAPETWHKDHPCEDTRFYVFVGSVWKDIHGLWDESAAREVIRRGAKKMHPDFPGDLVDSVVNRRVMVGTIILDFLSNLREQGKDNLLAES